MAGAIGAGGWLLALLAALGAALAWRAYRARMETVARSCHELRGPLTAARLGLALGARAGALSAERLRAVDLELGRAALAIDDLDDLGRRRSRGRAGPAGRPAVTFDLCELLEDSVEAWRADAFARGAELRLECPPAPLIVAGDRLRIAQATGNLIANALEHGGGTVVVRARETGGVARVEFADSGPGLPAPVAMLARGRRRPGRGRGEWGRGERGRGERGRGERGRGLAIALAVTVAHGGRLAAAPSVAGARLVLELPLHSVGAASGAGPAPTDRPGS